LGGGRLWRSYGNTELLEFVNCRRSEMTHKSMSIKNRISLSLKLTLLLVFSLQFHNFNNIKYTYNILIKSLIIKLCQRFTCCLCPESNSRVQLQYPQTTTKLNRDRRCGLDASKVVDAWCHLCGRVRSESSQYSPSSDNEVMYDGVVKSNSGLAEGKDEVGNELRLCSDGGEMRPCEH